MNIIKYISQMHNKIKRTIFNYLEPKHDDPFLEKLFNYFVVGLIFLNVLMVTMETVESFDKEYGKWIDAVQTVSAILFTVEYGLRLWTIKYKPEYRGKWGRLKYIFSFAALIDLIAILPFYVSFIPFKNLTYIRFLRLLSFFRFFKLGRYSSSFSLIDDVWRKKKDLLTASMFLSVFLIVASSFFIYMAENAAQPDKYSSIPQSMYWSVITLTSTGYGDIYPITPMGKVLTMIITIIGIGMVALPIAIFSSGFVEEMAVQSNLEHDRVSRYQKYLEYKEEFENEETPPKI